MTLLWASSALAHGKLGHEAVAAVAEGLLEPGTKAAVQKILGNDDLVAIAVWADEVKEAKRHQGPLADDKEAKAFNEAFPENSFWHFVDLPLDADGYKDNDRFASSEDIVHIINECVRVLEGGPKPRFTQAQALKLLVHLVGDLHQPLHVGAGFYDLSKQPPKLLTSPDAAWQHEHDKGGNDLRFGDGRYDQLHSYWDVALVEKVAHIDRYQKLAERLRPAATDVRPTSGDYHEWAERWAGESVAEAKHAYEKITFLKAELTPEGKIKVIHIKLPDGYEESQVGRMEKLLVRASAHLAQLLNRIKWAH